MAWCCHQGMGLVAQGGSGSLAAGTAPCCQQAFPRLAAGSSPVHLHSSFPGNRVLLPAGCNGKK